MCRFFALILAALLTARSREATDSRQGYIEGEFVLLASPYAGQLQKRYVRRGDRVEAARPVFALEQESERAALALTHFLVLVRGIMLKGNVLQNLWQQIWPIVAFMLAVIAIGLGFYRRTLD